jgi:isoleucyl-tRNA synthetase
MPSEESSGSSWTETIFLPKTSFPMKADLPKREPAIIDYWVQNQVYQKIVDKNQGPPFILHDGPPYANGNFHVGHALNKILKDIIVKYKLLQGHKAHYVPGWDCHGLPIELAVVKKLANKKKGGDKDPNTIRTECRNYAAEYIKLQGADQNRFGVFWDSKDLQSFSANQDYDTLYHTMSPKYEAGILEAFKELYLKGIIYRGKKPVYWCPVTATAHAEAEVEYHDIESPAIYVGFPVKNKEKTFVIIWTTTPWTLPANLGVAFNPDIEYREYETSFGNIILAADRAAQVLEETGFKALNSKELAITEISEMQVLHPFLDRESKVLLGDHVTLEAGSGIVHTAPGHGMDDYIIGQKYGLEPFSPVDHRGRYTDEAGVFTGEKIKDANPKVIELIKEKSCLLGLNTIKHSYPHSWRSKAPLIFRATSQWFMRIDPLRDLAKSSTESIKWVPEWGQKRFESMVENRPDWCLSRQRHWGVPIPAFYCNQCDAAHINEDSLTKIIEEVKAYGVEKWFNSELTELLPEGVHCDSCGSTDLRRGNDILDVWFDSGISWFAVLKANPKLKYPADIYLEGSDQHRGWFQASLWPALALEKSPPMKTILTHGYVLDEKGHAMSKSLGNVISPVTDIIPKYGADVLRLWVSSEDYRTDNKIGFEHLNQLSDSYRKIRNTLRYILGNTRDGQQKGNGKISEEIDLYILAKLHDLIEDIKKAYENYEFHQVYHKTVNFCTTDLSNTYFEIVRDRLYCDHEDSERRLSCLSTLCIVFESLIKALSPILSFTMEEAFKVYSSGGLSVFAEGWPSLDKFRNAEILRTFEPIFQLRDHVNIQIEKLRQSGQKIGSSANIQVKLKRNDFNIGTAELADLLVVSEVFIDESHDQVQVELSEKEKCPRCWLHKDLLDDRLCLRCSEVSKL